jgi:type IV secretion system protein VirD4
MRWLTGKQPPPPPPEHQAIQVTRDPFPHQLILDLARSYGGGLYVGAAPNNWDRGHGARLVFTQPRRCLLVCAPSQTGKTTALAIPQLLAAAGPALCTSTKLDIFAATALTRAMHGTVWVYDPTGKEELPLGATPLRWSPIESSRTWDEALATARTMVNVAGSGKGLQDAQFWTEQGILVLAVLLYRAAIEGADMEQVNAWLAEKNADAHVEAFQAKGNIDDLAVKAAVGIDNTPFRQQAGYWDTAGVTIRAYRSRSAVEASKNPNFDVDAFVRPPRLDPDSPPSRFDTVYVTSGTDDQDQYAPLIVGLIESIRKAAYEAARRSERGALNPPLYLILDEAANIAPCRRCRRCVGRPQPRRLHRRLLPEPPPGHPSLG